MEMYLHQLKQMSDEELAQEIADGRVLLAEFDTLYANLREHNQALEADDTTQSIQFRTMLRMAEHERFWRVKKSVEFGSCPMDWPEEE